MENKKLIDKAIRFIQDNPKNNLSLQNIAENSGFTLNYFDALFKSHTGNTPVEYSRIYKLTRSALDLRRTEKSILEISLDFGYGSPESFTRAFKNFYRITPSEYREKYSSTPVTWHDLSGKIAINRFARNFPELKRSSIDNALDFCFMHNPMKYGEDIVGICVAESEVFTLGDPEMLEHFIYVSDYGREEASIMLVCENEKDALLYLNLLSKLPELRFSLRMPVYEEWEIFGATAEKMGLISKSGYDMMYPNDSVCVPKIEGISVRLLCEKDLSAIKAFHQRGGCGVNHIKAIEIAFEGKGNEGMRPIGLFENSELISLALPTLDVIRDFRKYDIGAIFSVGKGNEDKFVELIWKFAIDLCLKDNAVIGNSNSYKKCDNLHKSDTNLCVEVCEQMGLMKVAKNCSYRSR